MKRRNFLAGLGPLALAPMVAYSDVKKTNRRRSTIYRSIKIHLATGQQQKQN